MLCRKPLLAALLATATLLGSACADPTNSGTGAGTTTTTGGSGSSGSGGDAETVVVRPEAIDDVLINPGMGIQTFQRFNGQALNPGLTWSEEGPEQELADADPPPDFPGSSTAYLRWFWSQIEPEEGTFRWDILDLALNEAHAHDQKLAIRLMPYDPKHPIPAWYRNSGAGHTVDENGIWHPDFADPHYIESWGKLVAAAGARYDGDPDLEMVDIASIGYWGEGWSEYMPPDEDQRALIDIWFDAFPSTPLLMNFDEPKALIYGTGHGAGWRLDCLGDLSDDGWNHMEDLYPQQIESTGIGDQWQSHPVVMETCWVPGYWQQQGWDAGAILNQALDWHISALNVKSSAIPPEWKGLFDDFQKRMGYRLALTRLEYPSRARAGEALPLHLGWRNDGVAPPYRAFRVAIELRSNAAHDFVTVPVDVRQWLPGEASLDESITVPEGLPPGSYRLRLALLDPEVDEAVVALAIAGRQDDGWYDLGTITID